MASSNDSRGRGEPGQRGGSIWMVNPIAIVGAGCQGPDIRANGVTVTALLERNVADPTTHTVVTDRPFSADGVRDYLRRICAVPLLSAEAEVDLAKRIEAGLLAQAKLADSDGCEPVLRTELDWLARDGQQAKDQMITANLRLVVSIAKSHAGRGLPLLDLVQEGNRGLIRAVEKFDYTLGCKFSTYATWWIKQAITRALADTGRTIRYPVHVVERLNAMARTQRDMEMTLGRPATDTEVARGGGFGVADLAMRRTLPRVSPMSLQDRAWLEQQTGQPAGPVVDDEDERIGEIDRLGLVHQLMSLLPPREVDVLERRFGLRCEPQTLEEIGRAYGVTRERIRQLEARAIEQLRAHTCEAAA